jgi:membrane dipeptidase
LTSYKKFYGNTIVVDGHCDSVLELYKNERSFWKKGVQGHLDWPRLKEGKVNLQFLAFYIESEYKPAGALARLLELLAFFRKLQEEAPEKLQIVLSKKDLAAVSYSNNSFLLTIEGGEVLEGKTSLIRILYELGFRCLTLTWNQRNALADGAWENLSRGGLTRHGIDVVKEMNKLGMLVDVSHLADAGFWDVLSITNKPIVASHSCCRTIYDHPRNLSDEQLVAIKNNNGVIGINFYPGFLGAGKTTIDCVINHLEHAASIAGVDHVGLGSDYDGINSTPEGLEDVTKIPYIAEKLLIRGWKEHEVEKIMGGNYLRVLFEILP